MSTEQMRSKIKDAYPGGYWHNRVDNMSDKQVAATYLRLLNAGKL